MFTPSPSLRRCALALVAAAASTAFPASAATDVTCSPFVPHKRVVGDTAHDVNCTDATIQSAIDNACPNSPIYLTIENVANDTYTAQHLTITGKTLSIVGTHALTCSGVGSTGAAPTAAPTAPLVTISGNGSQSVVDIVDSGSSSSNVTFQYVEITGGGGGSGSHGGGIDFNGTGALTLDTSTVDLNSSNFGGGIEMNGNGGSATLTLAAYTVIESNSASGNGGGINIEGSAQLLAIEPFTTIGFNHAPNGKGGGVAVVGPARADIGSPGFGSVPVINGNTAALGGGISIQGSAAGRGFLNLFTTDPLNPVSVSGNFASSAGGALYVLPTAGKQPEACAVDFRIDGNAAPEGSAIYVDHDPDSTLGGAMYFNFPVCASNQPSKACKAGIACSTLNGNTAQDADNHPKPGAVIFVYYADLSSLLFDHFSMRDNAGAHAIRTISAEPTISHCLIADNDFSGEMIRLDDDGNVGVGVIRKCTIAGNTHNSGSVIHAETSIYVEDSILDQPVMSSISFGGVPSISASNILAADPTGLPPQDTIVQGEPIYASVLNGAAGDYHLAAFVQDGNVIHSPGIDFAAWTQDQDFDLDGNPYDQDVPAVANLFGPGDLGCYEAQPIPDRVFTDGLGDPVSLLY